MKLKATSLGALALLAASATSQAAPPAQLYADWGVDPTVKNAVVQLAPGAFNHMFTFILGANNLSTVSTVSSAFSLLGTDYVSIANGSFGLYAFGADNLAGTGDDVVIPGSTKSFGNDVFGETQLTLAAGSYYVNVTGNANGTLGGKYIVASSFVATPPVPEPQTYALMLAGLAGLGFIAKRRSS